MNEKRLSLAHVPYSNARMALLLLLNNRVYMTNAVGNIFDDRDTIALISNAVGDADGIDIKIKCEMKLLITERRFNIKCKEQIFPFFNNVHQQQLQKKTRK